MHGIEFGNNAAHREIPWPWNWKDFSLSLSADLIAIRRRFTVFSKQRRCTGQPIETFGSSCISGHWKSERADVGTSGTSTSARTPTFPCKQFPRSPRYLGSFVRLSYQAYQKLILLQTECVLGTLTMQHNPCPTLQQFQCRLSSEEHTIYNPCGRAVVGAAVFLQRVSSFCAF